MEKPGYAPNYLANHLRRLEGAMVAMTSMRRVEQLLQHESIHFQVGLRGEVLSEPFERNCAFSRRHS